MVASRGNALSTDALVEGVGPARRSIDDRGRKEVVGRGVLDATEELAFIGATD